jgi:hypothetical protein
MMTFVQADSRVWLEEALAADFASIHDRQAVSGRNPHFKCTVNGHRVLVRTPTRGGLWSFLGWRHLSTRRIRRETTALEVALQSGLKVPQLLAFKVEGGLFKKITCVYSVIEGVRPFDEALMELRGPARWYLLKRVASAVWTMHRAGILHGDLNARNILIGDSIYFVDFDGARLARTGGFNEIVRLCRSLEKIFGKRLMPTDKARLIRAYIDPKWMLKPSLVRCESRIAWHRCWWKITSASGPA